MNERIRRAIFSIEEMIEQQNIWRNDKCKKTKTSKLRSATIPTLEFNSDDTALHNHLINLAFEKINNIIVSYQMHRSDQMVIVNKGT
jgi:DNA replication protein DnaC